MAKPLRLQLSRHDALRFVYLVQLTMEILKFECHLLLVSARYYLVHHFSLKKCPFWRKVKSSAFNKVKTITFQFEFIYSQYLIVASNLPPFFMAHMVFVFKRRLIVMRLLCSFISSFYFIRIFVLVHQFHLKF
jgi:hypothetical protein